MRYLCRRCGHDFGEGPVSTRTVSTCNYCREDVLRAETLQRPMDDIVWEWWESELANEAAATAVPDEATR